MQYNIHNRPRFVQQPVQSERVSGWIFVDVDLSAVQATCVFVVQLGMRAPSYRELLLDVP